MMRLLLVTLVCIVLTAADRPRSSDHAWRKSQRDHRRELGDEPHPISDEMKPLVVMMIRHGFESYIRHAFPSDEIRPIEGTGHDTLGSYALTLVDSLDLLALSGMHDEFRQHSRWVQEHVHFAIDKEVSVFETSIRILGGLLSAHFMYEEGIVEIDPDVDSYDGGLLRLAVDLGERLLPAFATPTGIPYGTVNLLRGVPLGEIDITSTASGGTFIMEMTVLSAVTGDPAFEAAARKATLALVEHRASGSHLVGNHINITSGVWTIAQSSVGSGVDSLIEYLIKGYGFTGDPAMYKGYRIMREAFSTHTRRGPWFMEMSLHGHLIHPLHNSLASFYPGNIALSGMDVEEAVETCMATHFIMKRQGGIPEGFHLGASAVQAGQQGFPLRPEHAESIYMLYRLSGDPVYLEMGKEFALMLWTRTATRCGFAALNDCTLPPGDSKYTDAMESFVLSETLKYLFLLFDEKNALHKVYTPNDATNIEAEDGDAGDKPASWIFNTEGHPLPVRSEWRWWRLLEQTQHRYEASQTTKPETPPARPESYTDKIRRAVTSELTNEGRWVNEQASRDARFDVIEREYPNEYAAWSRFDGHKKCRAMNYRCLFDPAAVPQSGPIPHFTSTQRTEAGNAVIYRIFDEVEVLDAAFRCNGRQHRNDFSRLSKGLFYDTFEPSG
jgi:ER degradation enhancer, mannosidase alpha-like 2